MKSLIEKTTFILMLSAILIIGGAIEIAQTVFETLREIIRPERP